MKKILLSMTVALAFAGAVFASDTVRVWIKTVADPDVPEVIGTVASSFRTIAFIGQLDERTPNTGNVWIQRSNTNGAPGIKLEPGKMISISSSDRSMDGGDFWIDVETAGDGVLIMTLR